MSKIVIAEDPAQAIIKGWEDELDATLPDSSRTVILRAVQHGRLDYADSEFTLTLNKPIEMQNGKTVEVLKIKEPTGRNIIDSTKNTAAQEQQLRLLSNIAGVAIGVLERIGSRDLYVAVAILDFFG